MNKTQQIEDADMSDADLVLMAAQIEAELARLAARIEAMDARTAAEAPIQPAVIAPLCAAADAPVVSETPAMLPAAPIVTFQSMKTRTPARRRSRRKGRVSVAIRAITGSCIALALLMEPAGSVSLYNPATTPGLYQVAPKVYRIGDIITIAVEEATSAESTWKAERDKQTQVSATTAPTGDGAGTKNLFGLFFPFMNLDYQAQTKTDNNSDRSTSFNATLAAEVLNVLPNGNLQIYAKKVTRVNSEEQLIELTGNIRPLDITARNTISSNYIADASIKVNGTLRYTNDNKPSVLERVVSFVTGLFL